jgi:hypothetical protein
LDFGLAKLLDLGPPQGPQGAERLRQPSIAQTQSGMVVGTPAYMSPEQVRSLPVDSRADLFSLGVLLFEMVTGMSPYRRDSFMDALHAVAFEETPPMSTLRAGVPDQLQRIVSRCLAKRPEDRYANARLLAGDLRAVRKDMEAGIVQKTSWAQRVQEAWERLRRMPPSRYGWYAAGVAGLGMAVYFSLSKIGLGGLIFMTLTAGFLYRHIRNRPHAVQELFVRRVSRIPEVRLIAFQEREVCVVVDHPVAQLYGRINDQLRRCNRKLYSGQPMTVSILHDVPDEQFQHILAAPGVNYVRPDRVGKS